MLETGRYTTISEIAKAQNINPSYVSRVLRLTLLARRRRWRRSWMSDFLMSRHAPAVASIKPPLAVRKRARCADFRTSRHSFV